MKILVVGSTGLLGTDLCRLLSNHAVTGWSRKSGQDIANAQLIHEQMRQLAPEVVIHTAAMTDVDACEKEPGLAEKINVQGTKTVAQAAQESGAFLIAIGTDYVFDGKLDRPYRETDPANPISRYGQSKLDAEYEAQAHCGRSLIARVSGLFGAARANFVSMAADNLKAGRAVPAVTDQRNSPSYTKDLAQAVACFIGLYEKNPKAVEPGGTLNGIFHLANAGGATRFEVAQEVAALVGGDPSLIRSTTWKALNRPARRPLQSQLDCDKFKKVTGQEIPEWNLGVKNYLASTS